ncbi:HSP20-like chaperones superfamily protein [Abeliophyllum distichum]|uniref:HSP20-like chaperones superfamily protein n=1 Tax=Abeliophyllum distichum TaxID=126358 RepID=A0ABD1SY29_9LAMI
MLFLNFYFKPIPKDKLKAKIILDSNGICRFDKPNLELEVFMVQHDMENIYMWVLKEKLENAPGKMQLQSYMNGHSCQGDRPFPFSVDKGFVQSHRMQRLDEDDCRRWVELTGRDPKFTITPEASDYSS